MAFVLEGGNVEATVGFQTRRELIRQMAPRYQKASISQKGALLDEIATTTGYARRYAMWLLNHPEEMQFPPHRQRQQTFGPEIQQALFFVWQHANQICTKRLMPYLATHLEALERHGHLHLTDSCRSQLLSMSAATADRLLRGPRTHGQRGLATTRAGTLLKQQISIRTFEQWNETQPGFLEADLVAHCASSLDGIKDGVYLALTAVMSMDPSWCCISLNYAAERMLQKNRDDLLGKNIWEVFPEAVDTVFWKKCYEATATQQSIDVEAVFAPTGIWISLHITPSEAGVTLTFHETVEHHQRTPDMQRDEQYIKLQAGLIELASDAIIVRDPSSTILSWNRGAEQLYGWTAQEAIGTITHELLQTRFPVSRQALDHFLVTGEQWEGELVHTCKNGTQVIVESRQVITRSSQNSPLAILEMNRNITARKHRERENQAQYRQLAALVESCDLPMIGKTREGIITSWNKAAERTYGYSAREVVGQFITLLFPADRLDEFARIMERIIRGERVDLYETARRKKDGTLLPVSITVSPIYDSEGQIIGASDIAHDITERKRIQAQEQFLSQVSHVLSSTLDYQETLANIARLIVPAACRLVRR